MKNIHLFVLVCMLLAGITFSVIQVIKANPDAPNPGHSAGEIECSTDFCVDTGGHSVGIGSTSPGAKLQINPAESTEGLRIVTASNYSPLNIRNNANSADIFRIDQAGDIKVIKGIGYTWPSVQGGANTVLTNSGAGLLSWSVMTGLPSGTTGQTLRHNGTTWVANSILTNDGTNLTSSGTVTLSGTNANIILGSNFLSGDGGDEGISVNAAGNVFIGGGTGKLTAGTIDPVYNIGGVQYSTYMSGMTGVKEETTDTVQLANGEYVIDFNNLEQSSDLWMFYRITDFGNNWSKLTVLLSAEGPGGAWYQKDPENNRLIIYSQTADSVSYRLSAPRFDWQKWLNLSEDGAVDGFAIDEIVNDQYSQGTSTENQTPDSSDEESSILSELAQKVKEALASLGLFIENGIANIQEIVTEKLTARKARLEKIEMVDQNTGEIYCTWIQDGEWIKEKGECDNSVISETSSDSSGSIIPEQTPEEEPLTEEILPENQ